jgi:tRNA (mo5U34)-methyltransferase
MTQSWWPKLAFVENRLCEDVTNWWVPNHTAVPALLRASGLRIVQEIGQEIFICEPDPAYPSSVATWNKAELLAATGRQARQPA